MPETISGAEMRKNGTLHSVAMAFASAVLPQPGGPYRSTPRGGWTPSHAYTCSTHGCSCLISCAQLCEALVVLRSRFSAACAFTAPAQAVFAPQGA